MVGVFDQRGEALRERTVVVPVAVVELDEADAPFSHPSSQQAVSGKAAGGSHVVPITPEHVLRLIGEVHQIRHARLHPIRHLGLGDPSFNLRISHAGEILAVEIRELAEHPPPSFPVHSLGIPQAHNGLSRAAKLNLLVGAGEKTAAPGQRPIC